MRSNNVTVLRVGVRQDVLNEVVAVLIACNFAFVQHEKLTMKPKKWTYYQSKVCVGGLSDLRRLVQGSVQGIRDLQS